MTTATSLKCRVCNVRINQHEADRASRITGPGHETMCEKCAESFRPTSANPAAVKATKTIYETSSRGPAHATSVIGAAIREAVAEAVKPLVEALERTTQQLVDLHAAIVDQGIEHRFIDDSVNMMSEGATAIDSARAALAPYTRKDG